MKEAAGEANMTVITIVLIGIVLAVGGLVVSNMMKKANSATDSQMGTTSCGAGEFWNGTQCEKISQ